MNYTFKSLTEQLIKKPEDGKTLVEKLSSNESGFCQSLVSTGYLTTQQMAQTADRYRLGKTTDGGVVFWEMDEEHRIRDGKVMYYRNDCHRDKEKSPQWISYMLKQEGALSRILNPERCLFGLHLLNKTEEGGRTKEESMTIAVVEAEKTAVICSELFPEYCWMAAGGLSMLSAAMLYPLRDYKVVLFPDTDETGQAYKHWKAVADTAQENFDYPIRVSRILEEQATCQQKAAKIDIIDYLFPDNR
ncbi:MAG: hypothetical protein IKN01_04025 [Prevotella sp.]|nr:hypothetical protein [Prevotella sp.]